MANPAMKIISKSSAEYIDSPATMKGTFTKAFGLTLVTIISAVLSGSSFWYVSCWFTSSVWYIGFRHDCGRSTYNSDLL